MKGSKRKIRFNWKKLAENKGVYIALASIAFVVGFYVYGRYARESLENDIVSFDENAWQEAVSESGVQVIDVDVKEEAPKVQEGSSQKSQKNVTEDRAQTKETLVLEEAVETVAEQEREFSMIMPVSGEILAECSVEELVYCAAMEDWRTHNGMDIAAAEGDPVKAAEDGVVSKVYDDEFLGIVVEVNHKNGISSLYGNLQSLDFISAGAAVSRGDIIGGVGKPGGLEKDSGPHLHFEVTEKGEYKNPREFVKD